MKTIYLFVTEGCNLSCDYCYIKHNDVVMTREVFDQYWRSLPFSLEYKITFFGGEPLMNWDFIEYVVRKINTDDKCKGFQIFSNGLLLDQEKTDFIKEYNIEFIWSHDGVGNERGCVFLDQYPIDFLSEITSEVNTMVTPNNLKLLENHMFFVELMDKSPSFRLLRDDVWGKEDIERFVLEFNKYVDHLHQNPDEIPIWVYREIEQIYKGIDSNEYRLDCKKQDHSTCLMPDESVHLCPKMALSDVEDEYHDKLYEKCHNCSINMFCEKQCYEQVLKNEGPVDTICCLYMTIYSGLIELDKRLTESNNKEWEEFVRSLL